MSRLDSFIRRMQAQRACLDWAADRIADLPGPALELGLGNGRTYDHLRERLGGREIFVFDRQIGAHPSCIPPDDHFYLGDIAETLPRLTARIGRTASLVHTDLGTGDERRNAELAAFIGSALAGLVRPGGIVISDQALSVPGWRRLPEPPGVPRDRYFLYEAG